MELSWEDAPVPEPHCLLFNKDLYDRFSLAPTIKELWAAAQSPAVKSEVKAELAEPTGPVDCASIQNENKISADSQDEDCDRKEHPPRDPAAETFPEPRVPYPCVSSLTRKDQLTYLNVLTSKQPRTASQYLLQRVNTERSEFMRYLQDVAKMCPDDYKYISQGAALYSEEYLRACLDQIKTYPQFYKILEITSLTGGTFSSSLQFNFEKQLLAMGEVVITDHKVVANEAQLASDYETVSSCIPPAKNAERSHAAVSTDSNAEMLSSRYEPHVVLSRDSLTRLLNNHGPDFPDAWEVPVVVKINAGKGSSHSKTVYVDPPLLLTEMSARDRSQLFNEESIQLSINKNGSKSVYHVMTETPAMYKQLPAESSQRTLVSFETSVLDFGLDLTDLETFGETTQSSKSPKAQKLQKEIASQHNYASSQSKEKSNQTCRISSIQEKEAQQEVNLDMAEGPGAQQKVVQSPAGMSSPVRCAKPLRNDSQESEEDLVTGQGSELSSGVDSEDERLVIDDPLSPDSTSRAQCNTKPSTKLPLSPPGEAVPDSPNRARTSPSSLTGTRRVGRKPRVPGRCDQLGQILAMQKAMLKPSPRQNQPPDTPCPSNPQAPPPSRGLPRPHPQPSSQSLVKPCVSSYLQSTQDEETYVQAPAGPAPIDKENSAHHKRLLCESLLCGAEDERDFLAPVEGNLLYKLYSLEDLLLLVRSQVSLAHTHKVGMENKMVPVHVLCKMEYQLCYGVEALTKKEACRLWAEKLLHSSTVSYIGHVDAQTSKLALLRKLPADWKPSCDFRPAKSLNILHHLLKKMTGLSEGRYLIGHKTGEPFVTIFKATEGQSMVRGLYDLHQTHCKVPSPPETGPLPWVPLDHTVVLPFHKRHGRLPCTFPPLELQHRQKARTGRAGGQAEANPTSSHRAKKGKKKNVNRTVKGKKWINKPRQNNL
ncbi:hypothetical protein UPYG_G00273780 [Umbra pygmaea]|uniref:Little elongation complex subunit 2 C-terminal domain-containing protein n=1 Tax=Umbra pygmaea TaxID=75934 RepID=A0ABD0X1U0_UMBPY